MTCEEYRPLVSGHLDGELSPEESVRLRSHLSTCPDCRNELLQMEELKEVTDAARPEAAPDRFWDHYWLGIYHRLERGVGWILLSAGAAILLGYGLWELALFLVRDTALPLLVRVGVGLGAAGIGVLSVSVVRERLATRKKDPYREVQR